MKFQLGDVVRDKLTNVEGRVTQYIKHIYSQDRVNIQPSYNEKDMRMPACHHIDVTGVEKIGDSNLDSLPQYRDSDKVSLGDKVSYPLNGMSGNVIQRALNVNGCYSLEISFKAKDDGLPRTMWVEEKGINVLERVGESEVNPPDRKTGSFMTTIESE